MERDLIMAIHNRLLELLEDLGPFTEEGINYNTNPKSRAPTLYRDNSVVYSVILARGRVVTGTRGAGKTRPFCTLHDFRFYIDYTINSIDVTVMPLDNRFSIDPDNITRRGSVLYSDPALLDEVCKMVRGFCER